MKTIIAILAFVLFASPSVARPQNNKRSSVLKIDLRSTEQLRADYRTLYWSGPNSLQPALSSRKCEQELCSTAHDFCPNHHGDNG
jgi:hypothetical protein